MTTLGLALLLLLGEESLDLEVGWWWSPLECLWRNIIFSLWCRLLEGGGVREAILLTLKLI